MKPFIKILLFLFVGVQDGFSQDSHIILSQKKFREDQLRLFEANRLILLSPLDGWVFRQGSDTLWAKKDLNTSDWMKLKPTELSSKYADKSGKVEGWFRIKLKIDQDLANIRFGFRRGGWAATDIFVDGNLLASFGNTGANGNDFLEYNPIDKQSYPVHLETGKEYLIAIHFVDHLSFLPPFELKSASGIGARFETAGLPFFLMLAAPEYDLFTTQNSVKTLFYRSVWLSVTLLLALLFWLLVFLNPNEKKTLLPIALYSSLSAISNLNRFFLTDTDISFVAWRVNDLVQALCIWLVPVFSFIIITTILNFKLSRRFKYVLLAYSFVGGVFIVISLLPPLLIINALIGFLLVTYVLISSWKKLKGAQWALAGGVALSILFGAMLGITALQNSVFGRFFLLTGFYFSFPLSLVLYVSLRFREIVRDVQENAKQVVKLSEEKKQQALNQQAILEQQVKERTAELSQSLENLKTTQKQLIQSEKMASLGELTAGIAHEIQNPLNFVNNFSEVNSELIDELESEAGKGNMEEVKTIAKDIRENEQKINHHGKRADAIVKGMLQHSRTTSGQKEPTDINALCDEYLRLSYHGLKAKDKSFHATAKTEFDNSVGKINIIPQDIGRVIFNLINNAFYAVNEKHASTGSAGHSTGSAGQLYEPTVSISSKKLNGYVEIRVVDNGTGIPEKILDKIFQPFFTTKPAGLGTGLGLSLAYDIVKAHGGEIKVDGKKGEGAEFIIQLPVA